jgi:hypothetical protein
MSGVDGGPDAERRLADERPRQLGGVADLGHVQSVAVEIGRRVVAAVLIEETHDAAQLELPALERRTAGERHQRGLHLGDPVDDPLVGGGRQGPGVSHVEVAGGDGVGDHGQGPQGPTRVQLTPGRGLRQAGFSGQPGRRREPEVVLARTSAVEGVEHPRPCRLGLRDDRRQLEGHGTQLVVAERVGVERLVHSLELLDDHIEHAYDSSMLVRGGW